jgi:glycosyltransferase involved in cell wall biosynthesis
LHIAINGYFLQRPATGSGEHLYYLLESLDTLGESDSFVLLYPRLEKSPILRIPHLGEHFTVREVRGTSERLGLRLGKIWWEQAALQQACATSRVDLLHSPYFASPLRPTVPTVVTIHDVIPLVMPEYAKPLHTRLYMSLVSAAARKASAILTVSETSKRDIVRTLGIPAERVHVTYNATDSSLQPVYNEAALEAVRDAHGITGDFLLYFGGFDVRKNVERLILAYQAALPHFQRPCQLVIAGSLGLVGHPLYPDPRLLIHRLGLEGKVIVTGKISEEEKPNLYSAATAFIFPSLYEGFGMPVLEAMACGAPVITSNLSSLPEVAGDAALLVDPTSLDEMAAAMVKLIDDPALREELKSRGLRRATQFSWEAAAAKTLEVYRQVVS